MSSMKFKERKSLCEESMLVFVNILKLSSLSIARRTLVRTSDDDDDYQVSVTTKKKGGTNNNNPKTVHRSRTSSFESSQKTKGKTSKKRSQKPEQPPESKLSYVILPEHDETSTVDGQFADYIRRFHEKTHNDLQNATVEGKAEDYIKKFHEKNMKDLNNESMRRSHYVLPPPPPKVFK